MRCGFEAKFTFKVNGGTGGEAGTGMRVEFLNKF